MNENSNRNWKSAAFDSTNTRTACTAHIAARMAMTTAGTLKIGSGVVQFGVPADALT